MPMVGTSKRWPKKKAKKKVPHRKPWIFPSSASLPTIFYSKKKICCNSTCDQDATMPPRKFFPKDSKSAETSFTSDMWRPKEFCFDFSYPKKVRPHRFGGEGAHIGVQTATLNAQVTFVNIAVAMSASAWGSQKRFRTEPGLRWWFRVFWTIFARRRSRSYGDAILGRLGRMRHLGCWSTENTTKTSVLDQLYAQKRVNYLFSKKTLKQHCKNLCFGPTVCLNMCKLRGFEKTICLNHV